MLEAQPFGSEIVAKLRHNPIRRMLYLVVQSMMLKSEETTPMSNVQRSAQYSSVPEEAIYN